jgi:hypothetical protein
MGAGVAGLTDMAAPIAARPSLRATDVAGRVEGWGFLANPDLPDRPGPAFLLVALRPAPTLRHFDPEAVEFWVTSDGRGRRQEITHATPMPRSEPFAWGLVRLVDRFGITNEYLTFGGDLDAALIDGVVVVVFTSPAPLVRRGGHSQGWDAGADVIGAFFGRLMVAVDYLPAFEARCSEASPLSRYAAFVRDTQRRHRRAQVSTPVDDELCQLVRQEAARLQRTAPTDWEAAGDLLEAAKLD